MSPPMLVPGSQTSRLDAPLRAARRDDSGAFAAKRPLVAGQAKLVLIEDASARAGRIGAARAALTRAQAAVVAA